MTNADFERGFREGYREAQTWTLKLNRYQRDNLLQLFNIIGYPYDHARQQGGVEPFTFLNSGDWVGEIAQMLRAEGTEAAFQLTAEKTGRPNQKRADIELLFRGWLAEVTKP